MTLDNKDTSKFLICRSRQQKSNGDYVNGTQGDYWALLQQANPNAYASEATIYEGLEAHADNGTLTGTDENDDEFQLQAMPDRPRPR